MNEQKKEYFDKYNELTISLQKFINNRIEIFNSKLNKMIKKLNHDWPDNYQFYIAKHLSEIDAYHKCKEILKNFNEDSTWEIESNIAKNLCYKYLDSFNNNNQPYQCSLSISFRSFIANFISMLDGSYYLD